MLRTSWRKKASRLRFVWITNNIETCILYDVTQNPIALLCYVLFLQEQKAEGPTGEDADVPDDDPYGPVNLFII